MQKIAEYNGTMMSLVLLEEKLASAKGLHVWECSCGQKFMTVYYASFHCEKYHKGEEFKTVKSENSQVKQVKRKYSKDSVERKPNKLSCKVDIDTEETRTTNEVNSYAQESKPSIAREPQKSAIFTILQNTNSQTILANTNSGITNLDHLWSKVKSDEDCKENSLFAPKAPKKHLQDTCEVSTQTGPTGVQIDFVIMNEEKVTQVGNQTELDESDNMDLETTTGSVDSEDLEPPAMFLERSRPSQYEDSMHMGTSYQNINDRTFMTQEANHDIRSLFPPPGPVQDAVPVSMIVRPELSFPIPDPISYPYPPFELINNYKLLYNFDDTSTELHWWLRAEFYVEVTQHNMNPLRAREIWIQRNDPNMMQQF